MMVVLAVIGLAAAMVIPRMGVLDGVELRSAARNIAGTIKLTYSSAAVSRTPHRLCFDLDTQTYWPERLSGEDYVKSPDPMLGKRVIPESSYIKDLRVMDRYCDGYCLECIYFTPGGYAEEAAIHLALVDDSQTLSIFTRPMTGKAVIVMEEMTREEWIEMEESQY